MTITANTFLNVNIGAAPNDGTGDPLRTAFTKLNDNFEHIENTIWPNIQITRLTTDVTSSYISTFNLLEADQIEASSIGNANTAITANTLTVNTFVITSFSGNLVDANILVGTLGNIEANPAFVTTLNASDRATVNNLTVNNNISASSINVTSIGNVTPGTGYFTNVTVTRTLVAGPDGNIANVKWIGRSIMPELQIFSNINLSFTSNSTASQYRILVLGNSSVTVSNLNYTPIESGVERIVVFKNNSTSLATRYINLPTDFNNLKKTNITVSSTGSAFMHFIPFDDTVSNVYVFIANV